ncbi:hypothetical protein HDC93_005275 [Streptomyces sp. AK010]|nr:hypothetical protein [Streptomyces sp. AK010]
MVEFKTGDGAVVAVEAVEERSGSRLVSRGDGTDTPVAVRRGRVRCRAFPFVVLTSNGEREFPPAFLHRCVRLRLRRPGDPQLRVPGAHPARLRAPRLRITDVCAEAVPRCLRPCGALPLAGVHGRGEDLAPLTPHPDCVLRALDACEGSAATGLVVGSTVAELAAAQRAGLRFVGLARNTTTGRQLRDAGRETTVTSLAPLLEAAYSL